jgi:hypothetical protein
MGVIRQRCDATDGTEEDQILDEENEDDEAGW